MGAFKIIILFSIIIYLLWIWIGRSTYICLRYRKEEGIVIPEDLTMEELEKKLRQELNYPSLKEINYDENGRLVLYCEFGAHALRKEGERLFIGKDEQNYLSLSRKAAHYFEEAECLKAYIQKLFDTAAPVNPHKKYKSMKNYRRNYIIATVIFAAVFLIYGGVSLKHSGYIDSRGISNSYLSEFSTTVTVGEAFNNFFEEPKWVKYEDGAQKMVDFQGYCFYDEEYVKVIITFLVNEDSSFAVHGITMNGWELPLILQYELLYRIYTW